MCNRSCETCAHSDLEPTDDPCFNCYGFCHWTPEPGTMAALKALDAEEARALQIKALGMPAKLQSALAQITAAARTGASYLRVPCETHGEVQRLADQLSARSFGVVLHGNPLAAMYDPTCPRGYAVDVTW